MELKIVKTSKHGFAPETTIFADGAMLWDSETGIFPMGASALRDLLFIDSQTTTFINALVSGTCENLKRKGGLSISVNFETPVTVAGDAPEILEQIIWRLQFIENLFAEKYPAKKSAALKQWTPNA